jgi:hypothetical protein
VLALGVSDQDNLDKALAAHGKILHDATVATLSCGDNPSKLGSIDWFEPNASSLSEMLVSVSEALKSDKPILDEQIATAFLTGIVAATDRFSNNKTSSKVMTMAAQLMAAGANQQLIAAKLEEGHEIGPDKPDEPSKPSDDENSDGTTDLSEGESTKLSKKAEKKKKDAAGADGELAINHEKEGSLDEVAAQTAAEHQQDATKTAEEELAEQLSQVVPAADKPSVSDLQSDLASESAELEKAAAPEAVLPPVSIQTPDEEIPSMGGTLNATTEQAQHDKENELEGDRNKTILSHGAGKYIGDSQPSFQAPFNAAADVKSEPDSVDIFNDGKPTGAVEAEPVDAPEPAPGSQPINSVETLEDIDRKNRHPDEEHADARSAVELAYEATPLPTPPSVEPVPAVQEAVAEQVAPPMPAPFAAPEASMPPAPAPVDFTQLPPPPPLPTFDPPQGPTPIEQLGQIFATPPTDIAPPPPSNPTPNDPNQFKIPGQ